MPQRTVFATPEVAKKLGIQEASLRRLVIKLHKQGQPIGTKITERAWIFSEDEVAKLANREDHRGDWQKNGGRKRYLQERKQKDHQTNV